MACANNDRLPRSPDGRWPGPTHCGPIDRTSRESWGRMQVGDIYLLIRAGGLRVGGNCVEPLIDLSEIDSEPLGVHKGVRDYF